jgi:hypothetical protein
MYGLETIHSLNRKNAEAARILAAHAKADRDQVRDTYEPLAGQTRSEAQADLSKGSLG